MCIRDRSYTEPCFGIGHILSLICQLTSEDIKHHFIIWEMSERKAWLYCDVHDATTGHSIPLPTLSFPQSPRGCAVKLSRFLSMAFCHSRSTRCSRLIVASSANPSWFHARPIQRRPSPESTNPRTFFSSFFLGYIILTKKPRNNVDTRSTVAKSVQKQC